MDKNLDLPKGPYTLVEHDESFGIRVQDGVTIAYVYFDTGTDPVSRSVRKRMTKEQARAVVETIMRALDGEKP